MIARRTGLSHNTIKKYLASVEVSPKYPAGKSASKLAPYADTLASWLKREPKRNRKRRRNLKQLHRDWGEGWLRFGKKKIKLQTAHFKLCRSRVFFPRACLTQTHEMLFDAHNHAIRVLGGIPVRGIYNNMKTAVDKVGRGKKRLVNARFRAMVSHFLFESEFCNPAAGWEKGQVEKNVRDARHRPLSSPASSSTATTVTD